MKPGKGIKTIYPCPFGGGHNWQYWSDSGWKIALAKKREGWIICTKCNLILSSEKQKEMQGKH